MATDPNPTTAGAKIIGGLVEALRAVTLVRAVCDIDGFEMTTQEAIDVLAKIDAAAEKAINDAR